MRDEIVGRLAATEGMVLGEYAAAIVRFSQVIGSATAAVGTKILALGNLAVALNETGRLSRAEEAARRALDLCNIDSEDAQPVLYHNLEAVLAAVRGAQNRSAEGLQLVEASARDSLRHAAILDSAVNMVYGATMRRAAGDVEQARDEAETAVEMLGSLQAPLFLWMAEAELAGCEFAAGERVMARARADRLTQALESRGITLYAIRPRLVLAAAALPGAPHEAVKVLAAYREQILSGNANWVLAMYMRAFPGLLGVVASVVGAECVPAHVLRMLPSATIRAGLAEAEGMLMPDDWAALARRLGSSDEMERRAEDARAVSPCRVRLFGALQVSTGDGPVHDADWKKRKARLLFAMLIVRKGKDVPRDQLLEYLWPDMDNDRARANFYVVWNNMKRALSPNLEKGKPSPYMCAAGGVCRVVRDAFNAPRKTRRAKSTEAAEFVYPAKEPAKKKAEKPEKPAHTPGSGIVIKKR